jgi:hypothetical protein
MNATRRKPKGRVYILKLEGRPDADSAHVRTLRFLLKYLLRRRGLVCVDAREETDEQEVER